MIAGEFSSSTSRLVDERKFPPYLSKREKKKAIEEMEGQREAEEKEEEGIFYSDK